MAKKTVLITGCSQGGLGDALACAFSRHGHRVIATARNPAKMDHFKSQGIDTLPLDVLSAGSIEECVAAVSARAGGSLDMLINNSGTYYSMPLADASLPEARRLFDLNVWAVLAVTQAFLPLLLNSKEGGMVVNHSSVSSVLPGPMTGIYNMSKAAVANMTDTLRLELAPFNIKVVDLKTGLVKSNLLDNKSGEILPEGSIYMPAKDAIEKSMSGSDFKKNRMETEK
ncbi:hypothetical protein MMC06_006860 [Schaereria dolodes]|nr:hypothetical protein [Schaereria dolodes]